MGDSITISPWWARGLIFENCSCTLVCPGHMHFSQNCTHERCKGYWAFRVDEGPFGDESLAGCGRDRLRHAAADDRRRLDADDHHRRDRVARAAAGARNDPHRPAGGPWEKLAAFVATQQPTEFRAIDFEDEGDAEARVDRRSAEDAS